MHFTRREFIKTAGVTGLTLAASPTFVFGKSSPYIDRRALVQRHNPVVTRFDPFSALSVGNGEFAFTTDVTGLQTFTATYEKDFPLCTMAHWAWHTTPAPAEIRREDFQFKEYDTFGRKVGYATSKTGQEELFNWLRENPHRLHLGRIAFELKKTDGAPATLDDLKMSTRRSTSGPVCSTVSLNWKVSPFTSRPAAIPSSTPLPCRFGSRRGRKPIDGAFQTAYQFPLESISHARSRLRIAAPPGAFAPCGDFFRRAAGRH